MIAEYKNSTTYFVHQDHLGSTRLVTGLNLAVVQNLDYFPHGEPNSTDSGITTQEFTGDESDASLNPGLTTPSSANTLHPWLAG
jgi:hypothetical protein